MQLSNVDNNDLKQVAGLARQQLVLEQRVEDLTAELKRAQAELAHISGEALPAALAEHGLTELKMADGSKLTVATVISANISKERAYEAHDWLRSNGHADLIKNTVSVSFGKGEDEKAAALISQLDAQGWATDQKEAVHPSTLKAFCKEQIERGTDIPSELFGIFIGQKTTIKKGK
jgi:predicted mannosyl-3-phosphoglycerate phosphatase (HAD superfamily)